MHKNHRGTPQRSKYTGPSSFPPFCTVQRPGFSIGSRSATGAVSPTLVSWCFEPSQPQRITSGLIYQRCLRSILGIKWQDHGSNEEVLTRASLPSIESILLQVQLRGAGHVTRMEDVRMPKAVFFSELRERKRDRDVIRKRYKDQLKRQLAQAGISHQSWQQKASDRDSWRSSARRTGRKFEEELHEVEKEKRRRQKEQAASQPSSAQTFVCPKYSRVCTSRIGLYSHPSMQELTIKPNKNSRLRGIGHHITTECNVQNCNGL